VKNYIGTSDDYFDFRADGKCYIRENGTLDTMTFKMPTDNSVIFGKSNGIQISNTGIVTPIQTPPNEIYPLTDHIATINFGRGVITPGGFTERILQLKK
jgi:hypothetical protein